MRGDELRVGGVMGGGVMTHEQLVDIMRVRGVREEMNRELLGEPPQKEQSHAVADELERLRHIEIEHQGCEENAISVLRERDAHRSAGERAYVKMLEARSDRERVRQERNALAAAWDALRSWAEEELRATHEVDFYAALHAASEMLDKLDPRKQASENAGKGGEA